MSSPSGYAQPLGKSRVPYPELAEKKGISPDVLLNGARRTYLKIVGISHDDGKWKLTIEVNKYTLTLVREQRPGEEWPCWTLVDIKKPK